MDTEERDELFEQAAALVVQEQRGSTSLLQRRLLLGYNRAGRIMAQLEQYGVVGPDNGIKPRKVLFATEKEMREHFLG